MKATGIVRRIDDLGRIVSSRKALETAASFLAKQMNG